MNDMVLFAGCQKSIYIRLPIGIDFCLSSRKRLSQQPPSVGAVPYEKYTGVEKRPAALWINWRSTSDEENVVRNVVNKTPHVLRQIGKKGIVIKPQNPIVPVKNIKDSRYFVEVGRL
jgi:hypothetical protein